MSALDEIKNFQNDFQRASSAEESTYRQRHDTEPICGLDIANDGRD